MADPISNMRAVTRGALKATFVGEEDVAQARQWGMVAFKVPHGLYTGSVAEKRKYIIYRQGDAASAKKVLQVLQKYPIGKRGPDFLTEFGAAIGEPPGKTASTIETYYGGQNPDFEDDKDKPTWLGVLSLAFILFLVFKGKGGRT